jgi:hypothetical protein
MNKRTFFQKDKKAKAEKTENRKAEYGMQEAKEFNTC